MVQYRKLFLLLFGHLFYHLHNLWFAKDPSENIIPTLLANKIMGKTWRKTFIRRWRTAANVSKTIQPMSDIASYNYFWRKSVGTGSEGHFTPIPETSDCNQFEREMTNHNLKLPRALLTYMTIVSLMASLFINNWIITFEIRRPELTGSRTPLMTRFIWNAVYLYMYQTPNGYSVRLAEELMVQKLQGHDKCHTKTQCG